MKREFVGEAETIEANAEPSSKRRVNRGEKIIIVLAITITPARHTDVVGLMSCCAQSKAQYRLWFVSFGRLSQRKVKMVRRRGSSPKKIEFLVAAQLLADQAVVQAVEQNLV